MERPFTSFNGFYAFYLTQHKRRGTRILHFWGTGLAVALIGAAIFYQDVTRLIIAPFCAYSLAWISHFFIERNRPATFHYPLYSLVADFRLFFELLTGKQRF
jgi:hypothetical protein